MKIREHRGRKKDNRITTCTWVNKGKNKNLFLPQGALGQGLPVGITLPETLGPGIGRGNEGIYSIVPHDPEQEMGNGLLFLLGEEENDENPQQEAIDDLGEEGNDGEEENGIVEANENLVEEEGLEEACGVDDKKGEESGIVGDRVIDCDREGEEIVAAFVDWEKVSIVVLVDLVPASVGMAQGSGNVVLRLQAIVNVEIERHGAQERHSGVEESDEGEEIAIAEAGESVIDGGRVRANDLGEEGIDGEEGRESDVE